MKVELSKAGTWRRTLSIEVPPNDVKQRLDQAYRNYSKSLNLPGFRKGRIPLSVVKARFGEAILQEVLAKTEEECYREASRTQGLQPVSAATIDESNYEEGQPLRFKASVDVKPRIDLKSYEKLKVTRPVFKVPEDHVTEQLQALREQHATEKTVERKAQLGDVIVADVDELSESGAPEPGQTQKDRRILIGGPNANHDLDNQIVGMAAGETRDVHLTHTHHHEDGHSHEHEARFKFVAKEVREREPPSLDDEFAKDVGSFETLAALKDRIRQDLEAQAGRASRHRLIENIVEELIRQNEFEVPASMVEGYLDNLIESLKREQPGRPIEEKEIREAGRAGAERAVKRSLLIEAIAEKEKVEVSQADVDQHIEGMSARHNLEGARLRQILGRSGQLDRIKSDLLDEKVYDLLIARSDVQDVEEAP